MSNCMGMNCAHMDEKSGKCTFSGVCVVKQYSLANMTSLNSVLKVEPVVENEVVEPVEEKNVFNPFQRGNGCMLAGYTHEEIWSHVH